jgi:uncharacterized membrane protein
MAAVDLDPVIGLIAVGTLPAAALAGLFVGAQAAAVVAIVGWLFLVPVLGILSEEVLVEADEPAEPATQDPLEELRERYARGDIDDLEFERRLERLLETEDVERPSESRSRVRTENGSSEPALAERER